VLQGTSITGCNQCILSREVQLVKDNMSGYIDSICLWIETPIPFMIRVVSKEYTFFTSESKFMCIIRPKRGKT
jgi:hypothetical protein